MNPPGSVDWSAALTVLAVGLAVGAVVVWQALVAARRAKGTTAAAPLEVRDLEGKRDTLFRQLRELEDTASKRTPEQLALERYALELAAAEVLLALDQRGTAGRTKRAAAAAVSATAAPTSAGAARADRAGLRGFLWGTLSATVVLLIALFVYRSATPRTEGGSVTGGPPLGERRDASPVAVGGGGDPRAEAEIRAALARDPNDVAAHLSLARLYLSRREMMGTWNETKWVLEREPGNPRALAYQALVRLAMGQGDMALDLLKRALSSDPDLVDGYAYTALVYVRLGRVADAETVIAAAARRFPDKAVNLRQLLASLVAEQATLGEPDMAAREPAANLSPGSRAKTSGPAASTSTSSGRRVSGTVEIDPSLLGNLGPDATLFVFVREAGFSAGPPIAARRLPPKFPAHFELGELDSMMGRAFPDTLLVEARLDSDGDPTTRLPGDPTVRLDGVKAGRSDLRLVLRRP